jgi:pilus assembly protein Flp/PilA
MLVRIIFLFWNIDVIFEAAQTPKSGRKRREEQHMRKLFQLAVNLQIWKNRRGQDLIEYALMAGFVAVAAGAIMPGVASSINIVFSKVNSVMILAASS